MIPKDILEATALGLLNSKLRRLVERNPCDVANVRPWDWPFWTEKDKRQALEDAEAALTAALPLLWHPLPPKDTWLRTRREGDDGENVCMLPSFNGEEWFEREFGRTTVMHHSFAAPTHWRKL